MDGLVNCAYYRANPRELGATALSLTGSVLNAAEICTGDFGTIGLSENWRFVPNRRSP